MVQTSRAVSAVLLPVLLLAGCAHTAYVRGIAGESAGAEVPAGSSICVAVGPSAPESEINDEIRRKLERLLVEKGFAATNSTDADYFLFFEFDRDSMMTRVRFEPFSGVQGGLHTTRKEGPFDLTIGLRLVGTSAYHKTGLEEYAWAGGAILTEVPTESPKFVDMLLVAAMKPFPDDTGETVKARIGLYDSRAKKLRQE
jgi:hypothetical protein